MRITAAFSGNLRKIMAAEARAAERAVTSAMREAAEGLKSELRSQITGASLGTRLARTWRSEVYPKGQLSISAAGFVWSKAPGIVRVYEDGAVIRSTKGFFLAIPTQAAGKHGDGRKKITPGSWERRTGQRLRFVYRRGVPSLLVADLRARTGRRGGFSGPSLSARRTGRGLATVPIFILVPQVRVKKRLDVEGAARRWQGQLPALIARNWSDPS